MKNLEAFDSARDDALTRARQAAGYLSPREARFLFTIAALTPVDGDVLEIGSFKGRSTIMLAHGARWYGRGVVHAVDPHNAPSETDPSLGDASTSFDEFTANIARAGVADNVRPQVSRSETFASQFDGPLRVLWIDGDHTLRGARQDFELFLPRVVPGGIVAMHDVLGTFEGSLRVFCEDVLASDRFTNAGFCGSIGWAQYDPAAGRRPAHRLRRRLLGFPAKQLLPVAASGEGLKGWNKWRYKIWRSLAPHGEVNPATWLRRVTNGARPVAG